MSALVVPRPAGLYCPAGDFYIDPASPVARAVVTHAHGDHARPGSMQYWCSREGEGLMRARVGAKSWINALEYGAAVQIGDARVSLHAAGHVLGSAQVRIEVGGEVWVVSGDYKRDDDPTCTPFEPVRCDVFVTEATFGLPDFRWPLPADTAREIHQWWMQNRDDGYASVLFCYALGKAQRILAELTRYDDGQVWLHGAMVPLVKVYRDAGVRMLPTESAVAPPRDTAFAGELILAPPGAAGTPWMKRFRPYRTGFASGWMAQGGARRDAYHRGFVLSDHADWPSLLQTIEQTGARRVLAMHGNSDALVRFLRERGIDAAPLDDDLHGARAA
ncbi:MAG TPA: ligase-associated DNA damage response exonuclease [Solimonas sp.]|nr:ligase-associated DNA damage response exonuclease [Solimonas sp.]